MEMITQDGEIIEGRALAVAETSMVSQLARVEIDTLVATARAYPRSLARVQQRMVDMATLDEVTAAECTYAVPRDGKTVEGPSIRFAEIVIQCFGNARIAARTTAIDKVDKFVEAEGVFLDCETNVATLARNRRRISTKAGKVYSDDMILTTCNAAQSIARRNAIIAGVPKAVWRKAHEAARKVVMGDLKTLANRRAEAITSFQRFGLTADQVFLIMGVKGAEDIDHEKIVPLRAYYAQLRNEEITVEELLRSAKGEPAANDKQPKLANPFDDEPTTKPVAEEKKPEPGEEEVEETAAAAALAEVEAASIKLAEAQKAAAAQDAKKLAKIEEARIARAAEVDEAEKKAAPKGADPAPAKEPETKSAAADKAKEVTDTVAALNIAFDRGVKAKHEGVARKALPGEYRDPGRTAEALKWMVGWDNAKAPE